MTHGTKLYFNTIGANCINDVRILHHLPPKVFSQGILPSMKQQKKRVIHPKTHEKRDEGPPKVTALPHRHGLRPDKPARAPSQEQRAEWRGGPTRERGRPARMLSRYVSLSFPAMGHPAALPVRNTMGSAQAESWPRCRSTWVAGRCRPACARPRCGRDARAPGCGFIPFTSLAAKEV